MKLSDFLNEDEQATKPGIKVPRERKPAGPPRPIPLEQQQQYSGGYKQVSPQQKIIDDQEDSQIEEYPDDPYFDPYLQQPGEAVQNLQNQMPKIRQAQQANYQQYQQQSDPFAEFEQNDEAAQEYEDEPAQQIQPQQMQPGENESWKDPNMPSSQALNISRRNEAMKRNSKEQSTRQNKIPEHLSLKNFKRNGDM